MVFSFSWCPTPKDDSGYDPERKVEDRGAVGLSHVGNAAYHVLRTKHNWHHHKLWNVTTGKVIGDLHQTPKILWDNRCDPVANHDNWLPEKMGEIISRTKLWCDIMSLAPPDGLFLDSIKKSLMAISESNKKSEKPVIIRMMFGNIPAMPVNCDAIIKDLTRDLPKDTKIQLWVGAWRRRVSWNHAKIIAVDGKYLHTGGHNMWDQHYLKSNPVHDLSVELEGRVARDAHKFANEQWSYISKKQGTFFGQIAEKIPDGLPLISKNRIIVSEFPIGEATEFPPQFLKASIPNYVSTEGAVPVISVGRSPVLSFGRSGTFIRKARPADDAFVAMIDSAQTIIRMSLQDLGPVCIPDTKITLPGLTWPRAYLNALARVIWTRGVDVEIVLSNPGSTPGGLSPLQACYGNGWSCVDVASEIIKRIKKQFPKSNDLDLRSKIHDNLRICFIKHANSSAYSDGGNIGLHSKFFMVDDICSYTGSQNLYICDLAEWGVIIDDASETKKMIEHYWKPMWKASYIEDEDCNVKRVMDGLNISRDGKKFDFKGANQVQAACQMVNAGTILPLPVNPISISQTSDPEGYEVINGETLPKHFKTKQEK